MISRVICDNGKSELDHRIHSAVVTVTVSENLFATKNFPMKILLEMIVSRKKHLGEVEYDKQIYPKCDIPQVGELF